MREIKNVVVACDYAYIEGGAAKMAIDTAILLSRNNRLRVFFIGGCGEAVPELRDSAVTCILLELPDLLKNPSKTDAFVHGIYNRNVFRRVKEFLQTLDPEETILHVHTWTKVLTSAVFRAAHECGIRIFLTMHDYFLTCPNGGCYDYVHHRICERKPMSPGCVSCNCDSRNYVYKIWRCLRQWKQNRVLKEINIRYIFISEFQREQLKKRGIHAKKEYCLRNVIRTGERYRVKAEENDLFLMAGRLAPEKGAELFCEAVRKAGVRAAAVGDGPLKKELEKKYPEIEFPGWLSPEGVREWGNRARCFVFPSVWYEGSPLSVPEMQAFGVPCIVTDCSAAVDTMADGKNGLVVRADVQEMGLAIRRLAEDAAAVKEMSQAAYDMFDGKSCSPESYVENLMKIYEEGSRE